MLLMGNHTVSPKNKTKLQMMISQFISEPKLNIQFSNP